MNVAYDETSPIILRNANVNNDHTESDINPSIFLSKPLRLRCQKNTTRLVFIRYKYTNVDPKIIQIHSLLLTQSIQTFPKILSLLTPKFLQIFTEAVHIQPTTAPNNSSKNNIY